MAIKICEYGGLTASADAGSGVGRRLMLSVLVIVAATDARGVATRGADTTPGTSSGMMMDLEADDTTPTAAHTFRSPPPGSVKITTPLVILTDVADAEDTVGLLQGRGSTIADVPGGLQGPGNNDSITLFAGVLADGTFELYMLEGATGAPNRTIQRYTSKDLISYVAAAAPALPPSEISSAAIAKDNATGAFLMVVYRPRHEEVVQTNVCSTSINASHGSELPSFQCGGQAYACHTSCIHTHFECLRDHSTGIEVPFCNCSSCNYTDVKSVSDGHAAYVYKSTNGQTWTPVVASAGAPSWIGYPSSGLLHHPTLGWIDWHVQLENLAAPGKMFPDNLGRTKRRVIGIRSSTDGVTWVNATTGGEQCSTLAPHPNLDPPEMEFAGLMPFWYGDRIAAVATNYAPSPIATNPAVLIDFSSAVRTKKPQNALMGPFMQQVRPLSLHIV
eukprot:COSAG02_NODE_5884_length_3965_cov_1.644077_1_plen_446_part_00